MINMFLFIRLLDFHVQSAVYEVILEIQFCALCHTKSSFWQVDMYIHIFHVTGWDYPGEYNKNRFCLHRFVFFFKGHPSLTISSKAYFTQENQIIRNNLLSKLPRNKNLILISVIKEKLSNHIQFIHFPENYIFYVFLLNLNANPIFKIVRVHTKNKNKCSVIATHDVV